MAQRRMFSKKIIDTDCFLEMTTSAQLLYFHLALQADDDGFISSPKKIMRMINLSEEDLDLLIYNNLIIQFENGVCVVKHWLVHNCIKKDRYTGTLYLSEMKRLSKINGVYELIKETDCIQNVSNLVPQGSLVEVSKDYVSKEKEKANDTDVLKIVDLYNKHCPNLLPVLEITESRRKKVKTLLCTYSLETIEKAYIAIGESEFCSGKKGFKASFDFCIDVDKINSALEGKYMNHCNSVSFADLTSSFEEYEIIGGEIEND